MDETKIFEAFIEEYKEKHGTFYPYGMRDIDDSKLVDYISWLEKRSMTHDAVLDEVLKIINESYKDKNVSNYHDEHEKEYIDGFNDALDIIIEKILSIST